MRTTKHAVPLIYRKRVARPMAILSPIAAAFWPFRWRGATTTRSRVNPYVVFLLYLMVILGFVAVTLLLNGLLGPKPVASAVKLEPFECGATPVSTLNVKAVPIKYYA